MKKLIHEGFRAILLLAILLSTGVHTAYAAAPSNDNIANAKLIVGLFYDDPPTDPPSPGIDTTEADVLDPYDPGESRGPCVDKERLDPGFRSLWYVYTPTENQIIQADTIGSTEIYNGQPDQALDTYIVIWEKYGEVGGSPLVHFYACNDDFSGDVTSRFTWVGVAGTTYYIEVAQYGGPDSNGFPYDTSKAKNAYMQFHARITNTDVVIGNPSSPDLSQSLFLNGGQIELGEYPGINSGPVQVSNTPDSTHLVSSMRMILNKSGKDQSYYEFMGLPTEQASDEFFFPWYAQNATINSTLRITNVDTQPTTVDVYIKGSKKSGTGYPLAAGETIEKTYSGINTGPVRVVTQTGEKILASMTIIYKYNGANVSYSELIGLPSNQIDTQYVFPWYSWKSGVKSKLLISNLGTTATTVTINIGNLTKGPITIDPGTTKKLTYKKKDKGPVIVTNNNPAVNIMAAMEHKYVLSAIPRSYSMFMGLPQSRLSTEYSFPWYTNNAAILNSFRIVNVGPETTDVQIWIDGNLVETVSSLLPGANALKSYSQDAGPVKIISTNTNSDILVSQQIKYKRGNALVSYSEFMGMPYFAGLPTTSYLFPAYINTTTISSQLRFGYP